MDELTQLATKYGTDKWGKHHYTPVYYDMFATRRDSVKKVVEIGAGEGASLRMWRDFFPKAVVYGMDNEENRIFNEDRITVLEGDQSNGNDLRSFISRIGWDIDLIVDDGSHKSSDQVFSCLTLMPWINKPVRYAIEDVSDPEIIKCFDRYETELVKCGDRNDDRLIIVRYKI